MKTYVITVSRTFPKTHERAGQETYFVNKIFDGSKIHTIRANYELWEKRINEVKEGSLVCQLITEFSISSFCVEKKERSERKQLLHPFAYRVVMCMFF
jgi:hypothetical protein